MSILHLVAFAAAVLLPSVANSEDLNRVDVEVVVPVADHFLSGTLSLPASVGRFPAVVLISGSGRSDRHESLPGITSFQPFKVLADYLADSGIVVLRYDDRGVGRSTGDFHSATSLDFADDAQAALGFLRTRPEVVAERIGILGHSEGGMVAPIVAARFAEEVAFVVAMAPVTVPRYRILAWQLENALSASGLSADDQATAYANEIRSLDWTVESNWTAIEQHLRDEFAAMSAAERVGAGSEEDYVAKGMVYYRGWLHFFVTHDPADDWRRVMAPVLALFGGRDVQVPAESNARALEAAVVPRGDKNVRLIVFPTANHLFQDAQTGAIGEYGTLPDAFVEGFLPTIRDWILATGKRR